MNLNSIMENLNEFKLLKKLSAESKLSHAFLITCEDESILKEFCISLAALIINEETKVRAGVHPDCYLFGLNEKKSFLTEDAENLILNLNLKPMESENKVFCLFNAEDLTKIVQNKLLKTLEEPPRDTYIIFAAINADAFLPTVKSRLFKINLNKLSYSEFKNVVSQIGVLNLEPAALTELYIKSCKSITVANKLLNSEKFKEIYDYCVNVLKSLKASSEIINFSRKYTKNREDITEVLNCFERIFESLLMCKAEKIKFYNLEVENEFNEFAVSNAVSALKKAKQKLTFNCSLNAVMDLFLLEILEGKYKCKN